MRKLLLAAILLAACGHDKGSGNVDQQPGTTIDIRREGPSPNPANAAEGQYVIFVNMDTITHQIDSSDCSWLNTPAILPGEGVKVPIGNTSSHCTYSGRGDTWSGSLDITLRHPMDGGT